MTKITKTIVTAIVVTTTTLFLSCTPVSAREITSVNRTETGTLYDFSDGTGYYTEEIEGISTLDNLYPLTGIVTDIHSGEDPEVDLITITCSNGNMFSWYADSSDCWEINDIASCLMDSKGTKYVTDDEVLLAHYAGGLKHLEQYAK